MSMFSKIATASQIAGALSVSIGVGMVFLPAGIVIGGVFSILFGLALERRNAR